MGVGMENGIPRPAMGKRVGVMANTSASYAGTDRAAAGICTMSASGTLVGSGMKALRDVDFRLTCGLSCIVLSVFASFAATHPDAA